MFSLATIADPVLPDSPAGIPVFRVICALPALQRKKGEIAVLDPANSFKHLKRLFFSFDAQTICAQKAGKVHYDKQKPAGQATCFFIDGFSFLFNKIYVYPLEQTRVLLYNNPMLSTEMKFIACKASGGADNLRLSIGPVPVPAPDEVLIKVAAAGLNRADLLQRQGKYPPPPGASDILGMEVSGLIAATGSDVTRWKSGDKVCALLAGGGYAEYAVAPESHCLPVPDTIGMIEAAALVEAIVTVYANLFESAALQPGETALIHGGGSGIGTMAIQMAKQRGCVVIATVGNPDKMEACYALGADFVVNYKAEDFVTAVQKATFGRGANAVLDMVGGSYLNRNLEALAFKGRHVSIATQQGGKADIDLRLVMQKQLVVTGSTLRIRDKAEKARLIAEVAAKIWPAIAAGKIKAVIYQSFPLKNAAEAHKMMESGVHIGKIVLEVA